MPERVRIIMMWNTMKKDRETIIKTLSRIITELVAQRQDIGALNVQLEEMNKSREQMYARLLDAFIKVASPSIPQTMKESNFGPIGNIFDEVPVGDRDGYRSEELELDDK